MKIFLTAFILFTGTQAFGQATNEAQISGLSKQIFQWEIEGKTDSLADVFDNKLSIVNSRGQIQSKQQYLAVLNSGNFKHDSINIEQSIVTVKNTTATVIGKGFFVMTVSGNKVNRHLGYMEVFTKDETGWKLVALYASVIPD